MRTVLPLALLIGCHGGDSDDTDAGWRPDAVCPGDPDCPDADGVLEVGAAVRSILPTCYETWNDFDGDGYYSASADDTFNDCGCDHLCPGDDGYVAADDNEGNATFDAAWMAGFGNSRPMNGVRDPSWGLRGESDGLYVRAITFRQGSTSIAVLTIDSIGVFLDDTTWIRDELAIRGADVDHVLVHGLHIHEALDTMGIWGSREFTRGYTAEYQSQIRGTSVDAILAALDSSEPVDHMRVGGVSVSSYHANGLYNVVSDHRDPKILIDDLGAAAFYAEDGHVIASMVNWASHPEANADYTPYVSADYVHALRMTVESGSQWETAADKPGIGGTCVYMNGALGGMMTPLGVTVNDPDGNAWEAASWEKVDADGQLVGEMALDAIGTGTDVTDPKIGFSRMAVSIPVDNIGFQAMFNMGVLSRELFDYDPDQPLTDENKPWVRTEVDLIDIGPIRMLTIPGEALPELVVGGYDGSEIHSDGVPLIDEGNANPPDVSLAPAGPYWRDRIGGEHPWVVALGNDELGYIIPEYNFVLNDSVPYLLEADGDHYEETNSLGPQTAPLLDVAVEQITSWGQ